MSVCPTCGQETSQKTADKAGIRVQGIWIVDEAGKALCRLTPQSAIILRAVLAAYPHAIAHERLEFQVYQGRDIENARNQIAVHLSRDIRPRLAEIGWRIVADFGFGYRIEPSRMATPSSGSVDGQQGRDHSMQPVIDFSAWEGLPKHELRDAIVREAARSAGVSEEALFAPTRGPNAALHGRGLAYWLLRHGLGLSLHVIGRRFGRDHTTVLNALSRMRDPAWMGEHGAGLQRVADAAVAVVAQLRCREPAPAQEPVLGRPSCEDVGA